MKSEELRIGNLIFNDRCIVKISGIYSRQCQILTKQGSEICARLELLQPIPLTEEWLLKAGFRKIITNGNWFKKDDYGLHDANDFGIYDTFDAFSFRTCLWSSNNIQYVHQLQNLYFALTGEELTFNL